MLNLIICNFIIIIIKIYLLIYHIYFHSFIYKFININLQHKLLSIYYMI